MGIHCTPLTIQINVRKLLQLRVSGLRGAVQLDVWIVAGRNQIRILLSVVRVGYNSLYRVILTRSVRDTISLS